MEDEWIGTTATVIACRYQSSGLGALAFGFSTRKRFLISFDYYAHGRLYSDAFESDVAIAQNETIAVRYNPFDPRQNSRTRQADPGPTKPISATTVGVTGSVLLALLWLLYERGCN
jgi:hypothetical protein